MSMSKSAADGIATVSDFPHAVRVISDLRIHLHDGRSLSARMWLPETASVKPVPAVVEYDPYRYRDASYPRDIQIHPWFAGHGYASIRLQPSGAGDSTGEPLDEYVAREQDDCMEALEWIAAQPWCSGRTGMFGMSWGANAALQVAARRPPSLKAIIPVHGTDNRYTDDIHFKNGCILTAGLAWGSTYSLYTQRPPDPQSFGNEWRKEWMSRLEEAPDVLATWLANATTNDYWRHGSVFEDYSAIEAATLIVTGWGDDYRNSAMRMAKHLTCPRELLAGPWGHEYPHLAGIQPRLGWLQIATAWWDRWLHDKPSEASASISRIFMEDPSPADTRNIERPGRWLSLPTNALSSLSTTSFPLAEETEEVSVCTPLTAAITGDQWLTQRRGNDTTIDQEELETGAHVITLPPLQETLEAIGQPRVSLILKSNTSGGHLVVRLSQVSPEGEIEQIAMGLMNLQLRRQIQYCFSLDEVAVGCKRTLTLKLDALARRIPAGYRLRVSIASQAWPLTWPDTEQSTLTLYPAECQLHLPGLPDGLATEIEAPPAAAVPDNKQALTSVRKGSQSRIITHDEESGLIAGELTKDHGAFRIEETGMTVDSAESQTFSARDGDPLSAKAELTNRFSLTRGDWSVEMENAVTVTADTDHFYLQEHTRCYEYGALVHENRTEKTIVRQPGLINLSEASGSD